MNIQLNLLKPLLKKLSSVKSDILVWDTKEGVLSAKENTLAVYVTDPVLKDNGDVYFFPAKKFLASVARMSGVLTVQKTDTYYSLVSNKTRIELEKSKYPWRLDVPTSYSVRIKTAVVQNLVRYTQIAVDPKQQGMTFSGLISFNGKEDFIDGSVIEAISTDGKRIAWITDSAETPDFSLLLPSSLASVFSHLTDEYTEFHDAVNFTAIRSGNFTVVANKFTTSFPSAKNMFPSSSDYAIPFRAAELAACFGRVEPIVDEENRAIELAFSTNGLIVRTLGKGGNAKDECEYAGVLTGAETAFDQKIVVDHKFVSNFLATAEGIVTVSGYLDKNFIVLKNNNKNYLVATRMRSN